MTDLAVNGAIQTVSQLLDEYGELIEGVEKEVQDLLQSLNYLLEELRKSNQRKDWLEDIRCAVDEIEHFIDKFLSAAKPHQEKNASSESCFCNDDRKTKVKKLAEELTGFAKRLEEIPCRDESAKSAMADYYKRKLRAHKKSAGEPQDITLDDEEAVGSINEDAKKLIKRLIEGPKDLDIIPIVGMVGLGKTTLAQKIYSDSQISSSFPTKIWIDVGQSYDKEHFSLETKVIESVGRCLVVLDDVWEESAIDSVKEAFKEKKEGHRIMVTTRLEQVANKANEDPHCMELLTLSESFKLLKMKVFGRRNFPDELFGLGKSIATKCSGLPLSVVVIAKKLKSSMDKSDWILVEKNVGHPLLNKDDPESCLKVVKLSYDHLPHEMKECYLYCGIFPLGFEIPAWKLTRLWIAERLIRSESASTLEETAEKYLNKLVGRNLLMVVKKSCDGRIKTCQVQDLLHEFCNTEAAKGLYSLQRLCIPPSEFHGSLSSKSVADQVRSFCCFPSNQIQTELRSDDLQLIRKALPLIRVLEIECLKILFNKDFSQLIHLTYLAISGDFMDLPEFFGNFRKLQTLIVNTSASVSTLDVKADIWSMSNLRHLHANIPVRLPLPPSAGKDSWLQTLSIVAPESCKKDVISKASNLKKLSIQGKLVDFLESNREGWHLKHLEQLKLLNVAPSVNKSLHFSESFIPFLCSLKKLILSGTKFDWSEANILGKLELLEVLKLKENAFTGKSWKPEIGGFTELRVLLIGTADLETWEASELHFPRLRQIIVIDCDKLKAVPYELAGVHSLQEIRLENTSKAAVKSAKKIADKKLESIKFKLIVSPPQTD